MENNRPLDQDSSVSQTDRHQQNHHLLSVHELKALVWFILASLLTSWSSNPHPADDDLVFRFLSIIILSLCFARVMLLFLADTWALKHHPSLIQPLRFTNWLTKTEGQKETWRTIFPHNLFVSHHRNLRDIRTPTVLFILAIFRTRLITQAAHDKILGIEKIGKLIPWLWCRLEKEKNKDRVSNWMDGSQVTIENTPGIIPKQSTMCSDHWLTSWHLFFSLDYTLPLMTWSVCWQRMLFIDRQVK